MGLIDIPVTDLRLDGANPRHDPTMGEQKIVAALMADFGPKIVQLADDIATNGLGPIDPPMVVKDGRGLHRLGGQSPADCGEVARQPSLTTDPANVAQFTALGKRMPAPITEICYVAPNRAAANRSSLAACDG